MVDEDLERLLKMRRVQDQKPIQTFGANGPYVCLWSLNRQQPYQRLPAPLPVAVLILHERWAMEFDEPSLTRRLHLGRGVAATPT
jgi:hypothetical protein